MPDIAFIGLGKLGLPMAACLADAGNIVHGVDYAADRILQTLPNNPEPGLTELVGQVLASGRLTIESRYSEFRERGNVDAVVVLVNTPEVDGKFSLVQVESAIQSIVQHLGQNIPVILSSTVSPGSCSYLQQKYGIQNLVYVPDFVALGNVIHDFQHPDVFIIGGSSGSGGSGGSGDTVVQSMHKRPVAAHHLSLYDAEVAKVLLNNYIALKISYANLVDQLANDPQAVAAAIGSDPRIGKKYFKPGLPWGGQCFPRDVRVMSTLYPPLSELLTLINDQQYARLLAYVLHRVDVSYKIAVLGTGFKPDTDCTDNSFGVWLIKELIGLGYDVTGYDLPALSDNTLDAYDTIIITHDDPRLHGFCAKDKLIDLWSRT